MNRWQFGATCPNCGTLLEPRASGVPTDLGTEVNATAQCTKNGCRRHWQLHLRLIPMRDGYEPQAGVR